MLKAREFLTKREFAERAGISPRTVNYLMLKGLPHLRLGGRLVRFPKKETDEWLMKHLHNGSEVDRIVDECLR